MKNYEIVNAVFSRDKSGQLVNQINMYGRMREQGYKNFSGLEKHHALYDVISKLGDFRYRVTSEDARVLRQYNVLVSPENEPDVGILNKSFVAVSDFHGYDYPLEKIKNYYLNEYDVVYILGDATDRGSDGIGTGSIKLLLEIMALAKKYPDRVKYLPGNHDEILLGYIRKKHNMPVDNSFDYTATLFFNGGEGTIKELNELEKSNPRLFNELVTWLSTQPLQRVHNYNGKTYVFGHAVFNQRLYDISPNYCLDHYFRQSKNDELRRMAHSVLWFRKAKDGYNIWEMPSADKTMIIGHTREKQIRGKDIDVCDPSGRRVKVHCVDGGIAYDGGMLKYDGGSGVIWTQMISHNNTAPVKKNGFSTENKEIIFQDFILDMVLREGKLGINRAMFTHQPRELTDLEIRDIMCRYFDCKSEADIEFARNIYIKTFLFDYILECQIERMKNREGGFDEGIFAAGLLTDRFIFGSKDPDLVRVYGASKGNPTTITSNRSARFIAEALGPVAMEEVLRMNHCNSTHDYINRKFVKNNRGKEYTKSFPIYS